MIVAHQRDHAAELRRAGEIRVAENVAGAVDPRPLAVPDAEHAVVFAFAAQLRLLRAPERGRREVFVEARMELDVIAVERGFRAPEGLVEPADGRAAIAGDIARGVMAAQAVALALHQREPHNRLRAREEHVAFREIKTILKRKIGKRHYCLRTAITLYSSGAAHGY